MKVSARSLSFIHPVTGRYLFFPSVAAVILVAWGAVAAGGRLGRGGRAGASRRRPGGRLPGGAAVAADGGRGAGPLRREMASRSHREPRAAGGDRRQAIQALMFLAPRECTAGRASVSTRTSTATRALGDAPRHSCSR